MPNARSSSSSCWGIIPPKPEVSQQTVLVLGWGPGNVTAPKPGRDFQAIKYDIGSHSPIHFCEPNAHLVVVAYLQQSVRLIWSIEPNCHCYFIPCTELKLKCATTERISCSTTVKRAGIVGTMTGMVECLQGRILIGWNHKQYLNHSVRMPHNTSRKTTVWVNGDCTPTSACETRKLSSCKSIGWLVD